jgi:DNA helicase-2/ATP-dependent DNA helicase PcrA
MSSTENHHVGGESLWRAQWSEHQDRFAHLGRSEGAAPAGNAPPPPASTPAPTRIVEARASAASFAAKPRADLGLGPARVPQQFGYGAIAEIEGNKLEVEFEQGRPQTRPRQLRQVA